jgi:hypothetical protein
VTGGIGPQGFAGAAGSQGSQGAVGAQGAQGFQGFQGIPGPQGDAGPQGPAGEDAVGAGIARFTNTKPQSEVRAGTDVVFEATVVNIVPESVMVSGSTITLEPGTYELSASVGGLAHGDKPEALSVSYGFFNPGSDEWIGQGGVSESGDTAVVEGMPQNEATAVVTVDKTLTLQVRVNATTVEGITIGAQGAFSTASLGQVWLTVVRYG